MKILFENVAIDATISDTNGSPNYPADNLINSSLRKRFQTGFTSADAIFDLAEDEDISCFFAGYTNADSIDVEFFDQYLSSLYSFTITNPNEDVESLFFDTVSGVSRVTVTINGASGNVYLGGVGFGLEQDIMYPADGFSENYTDNTVFSKSPGGQLLQNYIKPLRSYDLNMRENTRAAINNIRSLYELTGKGYRLWIDITEDNHDFIRPMYGNIVDNFSDIKNGRRYDYPLTLEEAR